MSGAPLPPLELCDRVGGVSRDALAGAPDALLDDFLASRWWDPDSPQLSYDRLGRELSRTIRAVLPQDWSWPGKRVLDFGCGAGRVLRHFLAEAEQAELSGCDLDGPSIAWLKSALCPPLHALHSGEWPPLPFADGSLDLIYAMSVYTHLTDNWSAWMVEHHRMLRPQGLLLASFAGPSMRRWFGLQDWDPQAEGMRIFGEGNDWDHGGPAVFHAEWWLRRHWGRAFEVVNLVPDGLTLPAGSGQGWVLLRRRDVDVSVEELERGASEPASEVDFASAGGRA
ncbi:MAG: class I SAM-dependent methyltransferase [Actinomycetota bacterium]|nr:class I SAM-dependent methyltransferase [Actinomycetota bacterium]